MDDHDRQLLVLGREHFERGEYDKAEYLLRQVIAETDRFADVHHMLGIIAHNAGEFTQAERYFERALQLNPHYTEAQLNLMVTYNELGKYDDARRLYGQIRERTQPKQVDAFVKGKISNLHAQVAQAYLDADMPSDAIIELERAVRLSPDFADLRVRLGLLHRDVGDLARARVELETARTINPNYLHARLSLGTLLLGAGEQEAARREFEAVLEIEPTHRSAKLYLRLIQLPLHSPNPPGGSPAPE